MGDLMSALGGPRDYAQALWSLCRGAASSTWPRTCGNLATFDAGILIAAPGRRIAAGTRCTLWG